MSVYLHDIPIDLFLKYYFRDRNNLNDIDFVTENQRYQPILVTANTNIAYQQTYTLEISDPNNSTEDPVTIEYQIARVGIEGMDVDLSEYPEYSQIFHYSVSADSSTKYINLTKVGESTSNSDSGPYKLYRNLHTNSFTKAFNNMTTYNAFGIINNKMYPFLTKTTKTIEDTDKEQTTITNSLSIKNSNTGEFVAESLPGKIDYSEIYTELDTDEKYYRVLDDDEKEIGRIYLLEEYKVIKVEVSDDLTKESLYCFTDTYTGEEAKFTYDNVPLPPLMRYHNYMRKYKDDLLIGHKNNNGVPYVEDHGEYFKILSVERYNIKGIVEKKNNQAHSLVNNNYYMEKPGVIGIIDKFVPPQQIAINPVQPVHIMSLMSRSSNSLIPTNPHNKKNNSKKLIASLPSISIPNTDSDQPLDLTLLKDFKKHFPSTTTGTVTTQIFDKAYFYTREIFNSSKAIDLENRSDVPLAIINALEENLSENAGGSYEITDVRTKQSFALLLESKEDEKEPETETDSNALLNEFYTTQQKTFFAQQFLKGSGGLKHIYNNNFNNINRFNPVITTKLLGSMVHSKFSSLYESLLLDSLDNSNVNSFKYKDKYYIITGTYDLKKGKEMGLGTKEFIYDYKIRTLAKYVSDMMDGYKDLTEDTIEIDPDGNEINELTQSFSTLISVVNNNNFISYKYVGFDINYSLNLYKNLSKTDKESFDNLYNSISGLFTNNSPESLIQAFKVNDLYSNIYTSLNLELEPNALYNFEKQKLLNNYNLLIQSSFSTINNLSLTDPTGIYLYSKNVYNNVSNLLQPEKVVNDGTDYYQASLDTYEHGFLTTDNLDLSSIYSISQDPVSTTEVIVKNPISLLDNTSSIESEVLSQNVFKRLFNYKQYTINAQEINDRLIQDKLLQIKNSIVYQDRIILNNNTSPITANKYKTNTNTLDNIKKQFIEMYCYYLYDNNVDPEIGSSAVSEFYVKDYERHFKDKIKDPNNVFNVHDYNSTYNIKYRFLNDPNIDTATFLKVLSLKLEQNS